MVTRTITKDEAIEWATKLWCRPENETCEKCRAMDVKVAMSIAAMFVERGVQITVPTVMPQED